MTITISFNTILASNRIRNTDGYGYGTERILASLSNLGYEVTENDGSADVGFVFNQPQHARYFGNQYKILFHPWESDQMPPDWAGIMNNCDEVWTPSPLIAQWYRTRMGVSRPIYVYQHGIDSIWETKPRPIKDKMKFLHIGGEAVRKNMPGTMKAFRAAFPGDEDVELLCKTSLNGITINNPSSKIQSLNGTVPFNELLALHYDRHVFVYPSWGEGFGFNPFQAMATGMPTIVTGAWAPYQDYIDPNLNVNATLAESPWQKPHPGKMFKPDFDDLVDKLRYVYDNYDKCHEFAQETAPHIHDDYAWDLVTKSAFSKLEQRLKNR